tara:strand:+ start:295 stop:513 length:219 start_codon:yes stop_codon:yes gene_type:complete
MKNKIRLDVNEAWSLHQFLAKYVPLFATDQDIVSVKNKLAVAFQGKGKKSNPQVPKVKEKGDFYINGNQLWL